jgi:hypothetical protein
VPVPNQDEAEALGAIIDRARASMGWGRLPEGEHDIAVVAWFEILSDAGMRREQYDACYRSAQQRKRELLRQGQPLSIVTPHDLCAELDKVREMNRELDGVRLLPENAAAACPKCGGTGWERMPDNSVRHGCKHDAPVDAAPADPAFVADTAGLMREALSRIGSPRPQPGPVPQKRDAPNLCCSSCGERYSTYYGFQEGDGCRHLLTADDVKFCGGKLAAAENRLGGNTTKGE